MRACEFIIEGDSDSPSFFNLANTLEELRSRTDQIRVDSLIKLVRSKPGSEMFNIDILMDLFKNNDAIKNMITNIDRDESGIGQVTLKSLDHSDDLEVELGKPEVDLSKPDIGSEFNPQKTVSTMAKRAAKKRI